MFGRLPARQFFERVIFSDYRCRSGEVILISFVLLFFFFYTRGQPSRFDVGTYRYTVMTNSKFTRESQNKLQGLLIVIVYRQTLFSCTTCSIYSGIKFIFVTNCVREYIVGLLKTQLHVSLIMLTV